VLSDIKRLSRPPEHLNLLGKVKRSDRKNMVVIGSRRMSKYGKNVIDCLVPGLVKEGYTVVSGLAVGCDSYSMKAALDNGGRVVGVLGYGLNHIKSDSNVKFIERVLASENGIVVSPFKRTEVPSKYSFVYRNSIMAAIGRSVLVIEAQRKSGVFYTVNYALELGRNIMAVPGDLFKFNSQGTHALIKEGAMLVDSLECILESVGY
jgi:DNA processing protein